MVLEGRTHRDVAIVDMRARILKREPLLTGALIGCSTQGEVPAIGVGFDLDETNSPARKVKFRYLPLGEPYFGTGNIISLKKSELQPFRVVGLTAGKYYLEWEIVVTVVIDEDEQELMINNNGEPFRITGGRPSFATDVKYDRYYEWAEWAIGPPPSPLKIGDQPYHETLMP